MDDLTLPPVAKSIFYFCKKCDCERYHKVIAHTSSIAAKIACEVCGSKKTYKITEPKKGKKMATKKKASSKPTSHKQAYIAFQSKHGVENLQPYNIRSQFPANAAIDHPKFGVGYVINSMSDKIEVCFEDSARLLIHNRN